MEVFSFITNQVAKQFGWKGFPKSSVDVPACNASSERAALSISLGQLKTSVKNGVGGVREALTIDALQKNADGTLHTIERTAQVERARDAVTLLQREISGFSAAERRNVIEASRQTIQEALGSISAELQEEREGACAKTKLYALEIDQRAYLSANAQVVALEAELSDLKGQVGIHSREVTTDVQGAWKERDYTTLALYAAAGAGAAAAGLWLWNHSLGWIWKKAAGDKEHPSWLRKGVTGVVTALAGAAGMFGFHHFFRRGDGGNGPGGGGLPGPVAAAALGATDVAKDFAKDTVETGLYDAQFMLELSKSADPLQYLYDHGGALVLENGAYVLENSVGNPVALHGELAKAIFGGEKLETIAALWTATGTSYVISTNMLALLAQGKNPFKGGVATNVAKGIGKVMLGPCNVMNDAGKVTYGLTSAEGRTALRMHYIDPMWAARLKKKITQIGAISNYASEAHIQKYANRIGDMIGEANIAEKYAKGIFRIQGAPGSITNAADMEICNTEIRKLLNGCFKTALKNLSITPTTPQILKDLQDIAKAQEEVGFASLARQRIFDEIQIVKSTKAASGAVPPIRGPVPVSGQIIDSPVSPANPVSSVADAVPKQSSATVVLAELADDANPQNPLRPVVLAHLVEDVGDPAKVIPRIPLAPSHSHFLPIGKGLAALGIAGDVAGIAYGGYMAYEASQLREAALRDPQVSDELLVRYAERYAYAGAQIGTGVAGVGLSVAGLCGVTLAAPIGLVLLPVGAVIAGGFEWHKAQEDLARTGADWSRENTELQLANMARDRPWRQPFGAAMRADMGATWKEFFFNLATMKHAAGAPFHALYDGVTGEGGRRWQKEWEVMRSGDRSLIEGLVMETTPVQIPTGIRTPKDDGSFEERPMNVQEKALVMDAAKVYKDAKVRYILDQGRGTWNAVSSDAAFPVLWREADLFARLESQRFERSRIEAIKGKSDQPLSPLPSDNLSLKDQAQQYALVLHVQDVGLALGKAFAALPEQREKLLQVDFAIILQSETDAAVFECEYQAEHANYAPGMPDGFTECLDAKDIVKLHTMSRYTQALKKHAMGLAHQSAQAVNDACGNSDNASLKQKNIPALVADAAMELRHMLLEKSAFDVYWNDIQGGKHKIPMLALDTPLDSTSMKARTVKKLIHSPQTLMYRSVLQHQKAAQGYAAQLSDQDKVKGSERVSLEQKLQQEIQWLQKNIPEGIAA